MKLFNLDLHISVIKDVEYILKTLFPGKVSITNWSISGHNFVFGNSNVRVDIVNQDTWERIDRNMIEQFYQRYKSELDTYDGFIVTHTPVFCLLFEKFNKPILCINSCRYDNPFCKLNNKDMFHYLNESLRRMVLEKKILTIVSNNLGDQDYLKLGTGLDSIYIPSLCMYTNETHNPKGNVLNYSRHVNFPFPFIKTMNQMPLNYKWSDLYQHNAIIHVPYEVSTMSVFEQFSAGIPLIMPSKEFFLRNYRYSNHDHYWKSQNVPDSLRVTMSDSWWIERADFYNEMASEITFFNSLEELSSIIKEAKYKLPNKKFLSMRKKYILFQWEFLLGQLFSLF